MILLILINLHLPLATFGPQVDKIVSVDGNFTLFLHSCVASDWWEVETRVGLFSTCMDTACNYCILSCNFENFWSWWRHQMETFSALLTLCEGNSPVIGEFPSRRPVTRTFDVFFDLRLNNWLRKPPRRRWFETPPCLLWRHCNMQLMNRIT